ncbi:hypothetical protein HZB02_03130 [Candidatus Woesearchaeota archaeon]|nr:hypothetical protein [Candidatus Woesearchaeota archaeon]
MVPIHLQKKGMTEKMLGILVLIVVTAIVFLVFYFGQYRAIVEGNTQQAFCKSSIAAMVQSRIAFGGSTINEYKDLKCVTDYVTVSKKESKEQVLATRIASCWDLFTHVKNGERVTLEVFPTATENYCFVCSVLRFDDPSGIRNFDAYLAKEQVPRSLGTGTYLEFLEGTNMAPEQQQAFAAVDSEGKDGIRTDVREAVVFLLAKDAYWGKSLSAGAGVGTGVAIVVGSGILLSTPITLPVLTIVGISGGGVGWLLGSSTTSDYVGKIFVTPYDNLRALPCTRLEGRTSMEPFNG